MVMPINDAIPTPPLGRLGRYKQEIDALGASAFLQWKWNTRRARDANARDVYALNARHARHPVLARAKSSDVQVFHQIFIEREYRCLDAIDCNGLIIDCGANVGYSAAYFLSRYPKAQLIA